jgi:hypothetical protein
MFRNLWYLTQFYAYSGRVCFFAQVFVLITGAVTTFIFNIVSIFVFQIVTCSCTFLSTTRAKSCDLPKPHAFTSLPLQSTIGLGPGPNSEHSNASDDLDPKSNQQSDGSALGAEVDKGMPEDLRDFQEYKWELDLLKDLSKQEDLNDPTYNYREKWNKVAENLVNSGHHLKSDTINEDDLNQEIWEVELEVDRLKKEIRENLHNGGPSSDSGPDSGPPPKSEHSSDTDVNSLDSETHEGSILPITGLPVFTILITVYKFLNHPLYRMYFNYFLDNYLKDKTLNRLLLVYLCIIFIILGIILI